MARDVGIRASLLIVVDHANNFIPSKYKNLGLLKNLTESHIAYDLNILNPVSYTHLTLPTKA